MSSKVKFITEKVKDKFLSLAYENDKYRRLYTEIIKVSQKLDKNREYGIQISKKLIPKWYIKKYGVDNLWKINLSGGWRLIYTLKAEEIEIVAVIIEWFDHKGYEKRFKYVV